jgi:hypothetical protein
MKIGNYAYNLIPLITVYTRKMDRSVYTIMTLSSSMVGLVIMSIAVFLVTVKMRMTTLVAVFLYTVYRFQNVVPYQLALPVVAFLYLLRNPLSAMVAWATFVYYLRWCVYDTVYEHITLITIDWNMEQCMIEWNRTLSWLNSTYTMYGVHVMNL